MNLEKDQYVIVEIIPTHSQPEKGMIAQISALKLNGLQLLDRFDYRLKEEFIENEDIKSLLQYDKESFTYVENSSSLLESFKRWVDDFPLLILEDSYTLDYLKDLSNRKELVYPYLHMQHSYDVFSQLIKKYHLEDSNYLVDLLYEAVIQESNKKDS